MSRTEHNGAHQPETPTLLRQVQHRFQRPDKMDRIVQEAQGENLLHGKVGQTILGSYEGHRQSVWMQRGANVMIAAIVVVVICGLISLPLPVSFGILGVFVLAFVICMGIAVGHLFQWWGIAYSPPTSRSVRDVSITEEAVGHGQQRYTGGGRGEVAT